MTTTQTPTQQDADSVELLRLWAAMDPNQRELALFSLQAIAANNLGGLLEELEDILTYDRVKAAITRGEEESIPLDQAMAEINTGRV